MRGWCAFDVEGRVDADGVTGVSIKSPIESHYYTSVEDALDSLRSHAKQGYRLVSHNAEYDISVLLWQYGEDCRIVYTNGRFNRGEWKWGEKKKRVQIWDTVKLSNGLTLAELGKALGLPKYETPQTLLGKEPDRYLWKCDTHDRWECVECYAIRDAEICYAYILSYCDFLATHGVTPRRTTGGAAVELWKVLDMAEPCYLRKGYLADFCRSGYFGGRVECFMLGDIEPCYTADVKSMYPSVMLSTAFPVAQNTFENRGQFKTDSILEYQGMSDVTVYIPDMHVPPLPVLSEGKLYFPIGRARGVWTHLELRAAMERGVRIKAIHRSVYSPKVIYPFTNYINVLMAIRDDYLKAGDPRQHTVKVLLNALYGRLGLSTEQEREDREPMAVGKSSGDYKGYWLENVGGYTMAWRKQVRRIVTPYANPLWAATITAAARVKLLSYLELQGHNIVYCDTDSVFSHAPILGIGDGLGELVKPEQWERARILGPKMYRLESDGRPNQVRAKGVSRRVADEFLEYGTATYQSPIRPRQSTTRKITAGTWVDLTKTWKHAPGKRHTLNAAWTEERGTYSETVPLSLTDSGTVDRPPETN